MKEGSNLDYMADRKALWVPRPIRHNRSPWLVLDHVKGGVVAWWLTLRTPDPEVGGSSHIRVAVLCP